MDFDCLGTDTATAASRATPSETALAPAQLARPIATADHYCTPRRTPWSKCDRDRELVMESHSGFVVTPWRTRQELLQLRRDLYRLNDDNVDRRQGAVNKVSQGEVREVSDV